MIEIPLSHSENEKVTQNTVYFGLSYREWNCWVTKDVMLSVSQPVSKWSHRPITFQALQTKGVTWHLHLQESSSHPEDALIGQTKLLGWTGGKGKEDTSSIVQAVEIFILVCSRSHIQTYTSKYFLLLLFVDNYFCGEAHDLEKPWSGGPSSAA